MGKERDIDVWREQLADSRKKNMPLLHRVDALPRPVVRKPLLTLVWSNPNKRR